MSRFIFFFFVFQLLLYEGLIDPIEREVVIIPSCSPESLTVSRECTQVILWPLHSSVAKSHNSVVSYAAD